MTPPVNPDPQSGTPALAPMQQAIVDIRSLRARLEASERRQREPIAIVGIGCRFPGDADDAQSFWKLLAGGVDAIGDIPADRWDSSAWYDPDPAAAGKMSVRAGGFLRGIDLFDPEFFGISEREAVSIDPQHRLLLEVACEALEEAGLPARNLFNTPAGVFIGISTFDYAQLRGETGDRGELDAYHATGISHSAASGRLAYYLGLQGPAVSIDTACSSSLVAVHLACQSLRAGECRVALAGGVNLILSPDLHVTLSKAGMMAADGRCKAFDDRADGFVRSEGCGIVVLKPLADALAAGDRIHAVIRGSACNQDGRSNGLTAPNGPAQTAVLQAAWRAAGIQPGQIGYLEAHGTGTALGDPIEAGAISTALEGWPGDGKLPIGSLKTNVGHMESAAGIGGLIKAALALENELLPRNLHFNAPSAKIDWSRLQVVDESRPWPRGAAPRFAGVSSFGFTGTNVHIVLEEPPAQAVIEPPNRSVHLLTFSALTEPALREVAARLSAFIQREDSPSLADIAYSLNARRTHFQQRAALLASSASEAASTLDAFAKTGSAANILTGRPDPLDIPEPVAAPEQERLESLAQSYLRGASIDWKRIGRGRLVPLPGYPWNRRRYWFPPAASPTAGERWQAILEAADRQAAQAPLDLFPHTYPEKYRILEELATAYILRAFRGLGIFANPGTTLQVGDLLQSHGILPIYSILVENWLRKLTRENLLIESSSGFTAPRLLPSPEPEFLEQKALPQFADARVLLDYVKGCGQLLPAILTGQASALDTLFPGGSFDLAERMYHDWSFSRYFNAIAGALAGAFAQNRPGPVRILEVGAGTGGTTASILPMLPASRTEYTFSDVSEFFFEQAARRFRGIEFLKFGLLDLEKSPQSQGYGTGRYDIVVAANVLHATKHLGQTLDFVRSLLAPDGLLVLYEVTNPLGYLDVTIGLIPGWHASQDPGRRSSPLLDAGGWKSILLEHGFQATASWPDSSSPAAVLGCHIFAARATSSASTISVDAASSAVETAPAASIEVREQASLEADETLRLLAGAPESEHFEILANFVRGEVSRVLRRDSEIAIPRDQRLMDLGLDSLMAVELRNHLEKSLQLPRRLPATLIFNYPSIAEIAAFLRLELQASPQPAHAAPARETPPPQPAGGASGRMTAALLEELSDAEVERLLDNKLGRK